MKNLVTGVCFKNVHPFFPKKKKPLAQGLEQHLNFLSTERVK